MIAGKSGILAIFPFVLLLVASLALLGPSTTDEVLSNIQAMVRGAFADFLTSVIVQVHGSAAVAGVVGILSILVALWSASRYGSGFIHAANAIYDVAEGRPLRKTVPLILAVTLALVVMLAASAILVVATGPIAAGRIHSRYHHDGRVMTPRTSAIGRRTKSVHDVRSRSSQRGPSPC